MSLYQNDKKIIGINLTDSNSTGTIMINSLEYARDNSNYEVLALVPRNITNKKVRTISFKTELSKLSRLKYRLLHHFCPYFFLDGVYNKETTRTLIKIIKKESRGYNCLIHLHNIHMCNLNVIMLYKFLQKQEFKVLYTLHDCWTFTGGCYVYSHVKCDNWKTKCEKCQQNLKYTKKILKKRTNALLKIKDITLIPCSKWLDNELKQSKLGSIKSIINNGETPIVPFTKTSSLKEKLHITDKIVLVTASSYWCDFKGTYYIYELAKILPYNYVLLVIGGVFDTKHFDNIIHINQISNNELAEYFYISDIFVSFTQADNLPLVLMEAQICGLPVVGFGHGGTPEEITDKSGIMVGTDNDIRKLLKAIIYVIENKPFTKKDIIESGNRFKEYSCAKRQLRIYKEAFND